MLASPHVKPALLGKILNVASLDLKVLPADKRDKQSQAIAEFVRWNLEERLRDCVPGLVWAVLSGGLVDGFSVCEKVWTYEDTGRYAGKYALRELKPKDVGNELVLQTDPHLNTVGVKGLRWNAGLEFAPADFLIYRHLPLYSSPVGYSDLRAAYGSWWMLDTAKKLRMIAAERRASPVLLGHYQNAAVQPGLERGLALAASRTWLSVPEAAKVEALNLAGTADAIWDGLIKDLEHDILRSIQGAILQSTEGETTDGRGSSQVHKSMAELLVWHLAATVAALLNDRDAGLVRDLVDLNYVVSEYPKVTLGAVDINELAQEIQIDQGLHALGMDLSKEELGERYGRSPPHQDSDDAGGEDKLPGQAAPGGPGAGGPPGGPGGAPGAPGGPGGPPPGAPPFSDGVEVSAFAPARGGAGKQPFRGTRFSEGWRRYLAG